MVGTGEHIDMKGVHCNFVIKPELGNQWSNEAEKVTLQKCGDMWVSNNKESTLTSW